MKKSKFSRATVSVRAGLNDDEQYGCVVPPITLSSTYNFLGLNRPRLYDYSRRSNPVRDVVQRVLMELECGSGSVITSSGMSAIYLICVSFLKPGDLIIAPYDCYGGTYRLLHALSERGLYKVNFVNQSDLVLLSQLSLSDNPKLVFIETPSNPLLRVVDIASICRIFHGNSDALCVVDNTFMSPIFQQPLNLGADFVVHSCTKYLNGHSDLVAGVVISKESSFMDELLWWANSLGVSSGAFDSYQLLRGIRTLVPRILQQQSNAQDIVNCLESMSEIKKIYYPGLLSNVGYDIAVRQQCGFGAIFSFELHIKKLEDLNSFSSSLKLFTLAESFGGVESLIAHPATMTHASMPQSVREKAGISDSLFRISVGIEDSEDLISDLKESLNMI